MSPYCPNGAIRARLFWPFCASTASASPRGRRERTSVRSLALGLASLYLHQTGKKAIESPYFALQGSIRALVALLPQRGNTGSGYGYVLTALRAYASARVLCRYRSIRTLCRPVRATSSRALCIHKPTAQ